MNNWFREEMLKRGFLFLGGAPRVMSALHQHREVEVNFVAEGELSYLFGGAIVALAAGELAVFWAMIPHQTVRVAEGTKSYCVHLPLARFLQWRVPHEFTSRLLHGEIVRERDAQAAARDRSLFEQWRTDLSSAAADVNHVVLLELEARVRRLARSVTAAPADAPVSDARAAGDRSFDKIEQMAIFITENYQERISTADIAAAANLHPNYAMALFRARCGVTLGEYLA